MNVARILHHKGSDVIAVAPEMDIAAVAAILTRYKIGAALVRDTEGHVHGIISERDIVRAVSREGAKALDCSAANLMTRQLHTVRPGDSVVHALGVMTGQRIRHLPVVDGKGGLVGLVSIGDLVKARIEEAEMEAESLREFVATAG